MEAERRLSDDEVSLVLRRAGEMTAQQGMTVQQVQEIAHDVGFSPEAVQRALVEAASGALRPATTEQSLGVTTGLSKDVMLPGPLDDAGWDVLVSTLRSTFTAQGKESRTGVVREWRNGRLRVAVEPIADGHRLRMSTDKQGALRAPLLLGGTFLGEAVLCFALAADPKLMAIGGVLAVLGSVAVVWPFLALPKWAKARVQQFDAIAREAASLTTSAELAGPRRPSLPEG